GSSIAMLAGFIHKKKFRALNGPEIFSEYIKKNEFQQLLLGSTEQISESIKLKLQSKTIESSHIRVMPLPFLSVHDFNYKSIANEINKLNPDIIWVSLGAPKQEIFMKNILPYINRGVMLGIGAAFNFYLGDIELPRIRFGALKFIWLSRLINEPKRMYKRLINYILILPKLYIKEIESIRK
ncbi:MAG: WecB/TagA/CpsF family glycosyltransferase, partial [Bacteroidia bacterium]|nr:WecB/TagA/CpsF family glycosyltransferase [Bacteroidia bacterium]